jgi:methyl-CpG-binding domain protein 4
MHWSPPKSPYNLIQEQLWQNPWRIFVACIFCNLTKRVEAEPYMWKFFEKYPVAKDAAKANPEEIEKMIQPLGLSRRRSVALVKMSNGYMVKDWKDKPDVLYGIGKYASDAYRIFCLGQWQDVEPKDGALVNYHNFLKEKYSSDRSAV